MAKGKILEISKRDLRIVAHQIINRPDDGRDVRGALKVRSLDRKIQEYLGKYGEEVKEKIDLIDDTNREMSPQDVGYAERMRGYVREIDGLDDTLGAETATNGRVQGLLLDHDEFTFLKDKFYGLKGIPAGGKAGDAFAAMHEAFEAAKEVKLEPVQDSSKAEEAV